MLREMLKSKIHRATITGTNVDYEGSISIDRRLLLAADLLPREKVHVVNINNGARFETYIIEIEEEGQILLNGAAARMAEPGDKVIIMSYGSFSEEELKEFETTVVFVGPDNRVE